MSLPGGIEPTNIIIKKLKSEALLFALAVIILILGGATALFSSLGNETFRFVIGVVALIFFAGLIAYIFRPESKPLPSAQTISGAVYFEDDSPVQGARVYGPSIDREAFTDDNGAYTVAIARPQAKLTLIASYEGETDRKEGLTAEQLNEAIIFKIPLKKIAISGTVVDQKGTRLPGVNVTIDGVEAGSTADQNGLFKLTVPKQTAWIIRYGYSGKSTSLRRIGPDDLVNLTLELDIPSLDPKP